MFSHQIGEDGAAAGQEVVVSQVGAGNFRLVALEVQGAA